VVLFWKDAIAILEARREDLPSCSTIGCGYDEKEERIANSLINFFRNSEQGLSLSTTSIFELALKEGFKIWNQALWRNLDILNNVPSYWNGKKSELTVVNQHQDVVVQ
jgi:hypothetical protein